MATQLLITILIMALAGWRLVSLLIHEDGPFDIFKRFRSLIPKEGFFNKLFSCVDCLSVWVGAIFYWVYAIFSWEILISPLELLLAPLAISALIMILEAFMPYEPSEESFLS